MIQKELPLSLDSRKVYNQRIVELIKNIVCKYYNLPINQLDLKCKRQDIIKVRHAIAYMSFKHLDIRYTELAQILGYNHSSIVYINKKLNGYLMWDKILVKEYQDLDHIINCEQMGNSQDLNMEEYYFINLNNMKSLREHREKAILFTGYSDSEILKIKQLLGSEYPEIINHSNTGLYLFKNS